MFHQKRRSNSEILPNELFLCGRLHVADVRRVVSWAQEAEDNRRWLLVTALSDDGRVGTNALWCLSLLQKYEAAWLQALQDELIDRVLTESNPSRKRILLQMLRAQSYDKESMRTDFLDFCLSKINSECEPYAVRSYCIYCAYKMSRHYPELLAELEEHLNMMSSQTLSPGLRCALTHTRSNINKALHNRRG